MMPRGLRNNNPLNIEKGQKFQGEVIPSQDARFAQFKTMAYGYRAAFVTLNTYATKRGCRTLADFIQRWAPANENNTRAYIDRVARMSGVQATQAVNTRDGNVMRRIVAAMAFVENGMKADETAVAEGWRLFAGG